MESFGQLDMKAGSSSQKLAPERTAIAAIRLRMRMRILARPENSPAKVRPPNLKGKVANHALRIISLAITKLSNGFANEMAKLSFSLWKFLANGRLRQNSLGWHVCRTKLLPKKKKKNDTKRD